MKNSNPTAYRYVRFSSSTQSGNSSLRRQLIAVENWAKENPGVTISSESFEDLGFSGFTGEHLKHAFGKLLFAIEEKVIVPGDYILIEAVDRMGRLEPIEMMEFTTNIVKAGVTIVSLDDGVEYTAESVNSGYITTLTGKFLQAHQYSLALSERVKSSWDARREQAQLGNHIKRRVPFWLDKNHKVIPEYAPIVEKIFEWYLLGEGQKIIQRRLTENWPEIFGDGFRSEFHLNVRGNKSKMVNPGTVKKWLENKSAIGYWGEIPDVFEPVVSEELFYKVQNALKNNIKRASKPHHYFIGGLAKCCCGSNLTFVKNTDKYGNVSVNSRCTLRGRIGYKVNEEGKELGCNNSTTIPAVVLDVIAHQCLPGAIKKLSASERNTEAQKQLNILDGKIAEVTSQIEQMLDLVLDGVESASQRARTLQKEKDQMMIEKENVIESMGSDIGVEDIQELFEHEKGYRRNYTKFNRLLQKVGYKLVCDGKSITVHVPDDENLQFKYLRYNRAQPEKGGQCYQYLCLQTDKVRSIPRHEDITRISKDVDNEEVQPRETLIMLEGAEFDGKTREEIMSSPELLKKVAKAATKSLRNKMPDQIFDTQKK